MSDVTEIEFREYYSEPLYMNADLETGVLYNRSGRRMIALTDDFMIGLHKALEDEYGDKAAQVLHTCGRRWGTNFGVGLDQEWSQFYGHSAKDFPIAMFHSLLTQEFGHNGWGNLQVHYEHLEQGVLWLALEGAMMAEIYPGHRDSGAEGLTAGIFAGLFSYFFDRDLDCLQTQCSSKGYPDSRFVISTPKRIAEVKALLEKGESHAAVVTHLHHQCS